MCEVLCHKESRCVSYNYGTENESLLCDLNDRSHRQVPDSDLIKKEGYIYRAVLNSCQTSPCQNNATCQTGFTEKGYRSICPLGYQGANCEADVEEYLHKDHNCPPNAICRNVPGFFQCRCARGYTENGLNCTDDEECVDGSHNCSAKAICVNIPGSFHCQCRPGYTGEGMNCTATPLTATNSVNFTKLSVDGVYEVYAKCTPWSNDNGFCRALSKVEIISVDSYIVRVQLMNVKSSLGVNVGHLGVMYNVADESNFDVAYFRPHENNRCYQVGYVVNGRWMKVRASSCPNGPAGGLAWFTVRVMVNSNKTTDIYLNNGLVTSVASYFGTVGRGGVLVANGYENIIRFRNFSLTPSV